MVLCVNCGPPGPGPPFFGGRILQRPEWKDLGTRPLSLPQSLLPASSSSNCPRALPTPLATRVLTWVRDLKPGSHQKHALPGIRPRVEAVLGAVRREDICHGEDEAEQPRHEDGQDDLKGSEKALRPEVVGAGKARAFPQSERHTPGPTCQHSPRGTAADLLTAHALTGPTFKENTLMQVKLLQP